MGRSSRSWVFGAVVGFVGFVGFVGADLALPRPADACAEAMQFPWERTTRMRWAARARMASVVVVGRVVEVSTVETTVGPERQVVLEVRRARGPRAAEFPRGLRIAYRRFDERVRYRVGRTVRLALVMHEDGGVISEAPFWRYVLEPDTYAWPQSYVVSVDPTGAGPRAAEPDLGWSQRQPLPRRGPPEPPASDAPSRRREREAFDPFGGGEAGSLVGPGPQLTDPFAE